MKRILRLVQPIGFALLLSFFVSPQAKWTLWLFWLGVLFTFIGTAFEVIQYNRIPTNKRTQVLGIFIMGIIAKLCLIAAIALRVYDVQYSIFILLACIVFSFIWFLLSQFIKPTQKHNKEFLDID
ncbi:MAG: hypothetical protein IT244_03890 [Bacteroidia bacterium]|nr:hypothetical protein [Bacteroidia bacterium]